MDCGRLGPEPCRSLAPCRALLVPPNRGSPRRAAVHAGAGTAERPPAHDGLAAVEARAAPRARGTGAASPRSGPRRLGGSSPLCRHADRRGPSRAAGAEVARGGRPRRPHRRQRLRAVTARAGPGWDPGGRCGSAHANVPPRSQAAERRTAGAEGAAGEGWRCGSGRWRWVWAGWTIPRTGSPSSREGAGEEEPVAAAAVSAGRRRPGAGGAGNSRGLGGGKRG